MDTLTVNTPDKTYPIYFEEGFGGFSQAVRAAKLEGRKACIITDSNVERLYLKEVKLISQGVFSEVFSYTFPAGEDSKRLETISDFYRFFLEKHMDRKSVVLALGGGVCGDMAGFAAASFMRGISFVQLPTTLLSQVDSSVGGKVGVDFMGSKNIIGAFYQPEFVYMNMDTLKTLPPREFSAGMAEVIKYGPIASGEFYEGLKRDRDKIKALDRDLMADIVRQCCFFKAEVVSEDEKESGRREILNFGHTIGHAIESLKGFTLLHGECVGIGMTAALFLSCKRKMVPFTVLEDFRETLQSFQIPVKTEGLRAEDVYAQMFLDKKVNNNRLKFVLLKDMGTPYRTSDLTKEEIMEAIQYVL